MSRFICSLSALALLLLPASAAEAKKRLPTYWAHTKDAPRFAIAGGKATATIVLEAGAYMGLLEGKPGLKVPEHTHPKAIEMLYVLAGGGWMTVGGQRTEVVPGMVIQVPAGVKHSFEIPVDYKGGAFKAVQVYTPSGPQARFKKGKRLR